MGGEHHSGTIGRLGETFDHVAGHNFDETGVVVEQAQLGQHWAGVADGLCCPLQVLPVLATTGVAAER